MEIAPFVALGIGMGTLTVFWEHYHQGTQGRLFTVGFPERVLIASRAVWFYLGKLFWPANLIFSYPRWTISPADPLAWLWLIALCALGWGAWWARRLVGRSAIVALAFFVVTLGPVLGFFMLYTFRYSFVADHYQYLACIGPIALVSAGMERLHERIMRRHPLVAPGVCAVLLVLLGFLTWQQSQSYQDIGALWQTTIAKNPDSTLAHNDLGNLLLQQGRTGEAMAQYREVLRIDPTLGETQNNVADILLGQGQLGEAIAHYREALEDNPANPHVQSNLGIALLQEGDSGEAIAHAEQAVELWPGNAVFLNNLAWILATAPQVSLRNGPRAVELATQATLASGSNNPAIIRTLAAAYAETGQFSNAVRTAEEALQLADSQSNLALASTLRREIELYEAGRPYERLR
jgi:tetratricopeptide (TPR) repeat protein